MEEGGMNHFQSIEPYWNKPGGRVATAAIRLREKIDATTKMRSSQKPNGSKTAGWKVSLRKREDDP